MEQQHRGKDPPDSRAVIQAVGETYRDGGESVHVSAQAFSTHPTQAWFDFFISTLNPLSFLPLFYFNTVGFMLERVFNKIAKDTNSNNTIGDKNMNERETSFCSAPGGLSGMQGSFLFLFNHTRPLTMTWRLNGP